MASITKEPNGRKTIQVVCSDKRRRSIRLGKMQIRTAETIKHHIEALAAAASGGTSIERETADWLRKIGDDLHEKIASTGLCAPRENAMLGSWLDRYIDGQKTVKASTLETWKYVRANLVDHFGEHKQLRDITAHDATEWRNWLASEGNQRDTGDPKQEKPKRTTMADNTVRRRTGRVKQVFAAAVDAGLIDRNPFEKLPSATHGNDDRKFFVPAQWIERCIKEAPNGDWRTIIALARFGGLRCPSDLVRLRWEDVDLPAGRMTIHSTKTEHHRTGGIRQCPIFPELRPHLEAAWDALPEGGSEYVITDSRYRSAGTNLGTTFTKIIKRAGLVPWEKLFNNLRASRETELLAIYPAKDVAAWLGNSVPVAMKHYAMPRAETFERATREGVPVDAVRNAVQQTSAGVGTRRQETVDTPAKPYKDQRFTESKSCPART